MERILAGKNILITGGTSALGDAFVRKALVAGASVFFTYRQNEKGAKELTGLGARGFPLDLSQGAAIDAFQKTFRSEIKILHTLIHNAATTADATIRNMTEESWERVLGVNLKAPFLLTKKLLPLLFKAQPAKVFFITSRAAVRGIFGASNYAASKAGVVALAQSLAHEYGRKRVLVNCVNPGFMKSRMTENLPPGIFERNVTASPLARLSDPDEVADFLLYLASDRMTQVTGQVFHYESRKA